MKCGVSNGGDLMDKEAVAPGLEELGVEICAWCGLRDFREGGKRQSRCRGGGELQHFAAGVREFWHRGNLRTLVRIANFGKRRKATADPLRG
jgi:hypothetical protein